MRWFIFECSDKGRGGYSTTTFVKTFSVEVRFLIDHLWYVHRYQVVKKRIAKSAPDKASVYIRNVAFTAMGDFAGGGLTQFWLLFTMIPWASDVNKIVILRQSSVKLKMVAFQR